MNKNVQTLKVVSKDCSIAYCIFDREEQSNVRIMSSYDGFTMSFPIANQAGIEGCYSVLIKDLIKAMGKNESFVINAENDEFFINGMRIKISKESDSYIEEYESKANKALTLIYKDFTTDIQKCNILYGAENSNGIRPYYYNTLYVRKGNIVTTNGFQMAYVKFDCHIEEDKYFEASKVFSYTGDLYRDDKTGDYYIKGDNYTDIVSFKDGSSHKLRLDAILNETKSKSQEIDITKTMLKDYKDTIIPKLDKKDAGMIKIEKGILSVVTSNSEGVSFNKGKGEINFPFMENEIVYFNGFSLYEILKNRLGKNISIKITVEYDNLQDNHSIFFVDDNRKDVLMPRVLK